MENEIKNWILVVEDEKPLLRVIQERFEHHGYDAVTARTCDQAKTYLDDVPNCSAIWLDHYLLGKDTGLDLIKHVKESPALAQIPIFVVTNTGLHDKEQTYLALGATKYYIKSNHRLDEIIEDITQSIKEGFA